MGPVSNLGIKFHDTAAPHSCSGASNVPSVPRNTWPNQGYGYVQNAAECLLAATALAHDGGTTHNVTPPVTKPRSSCRTGGGGSVGAAAAIPPRGICGYVHPMSAAGASVEPVLVFIESAKPQCFAGMRFTVLCRLVFCNHLQQISGTGATVATPAHVPQSEAKPLLPSNWRDGGDGATAEDDAKCEANPRQLAVWKEDESAKYVSFYAASSVITVVASAAMFTDAATRSKHSNRVYQLFSTAAFAVRLWDFMSDWGFFGIAVQSPRLEWIMKYNGRSHTSFKSWVLCICIVATLLLPLDLRGYWERLEAIKEKKRPPRRAVSTTVAIVCLEDVPQIVCAGLYIEAIQEDPTNQTDVDPVSAVSIVFSILGILVNLALVLRPQWFYSIVDDATGEALPYMDRPTLEKAIYNRVADAIERVSPAVASKIRFAEEPVHHGSDCGASTPHEGTKALAKDTHVVASAINAEGDSSIQESHVDGFANDACKKMVNSRSPVIFTSWLHL